MRKLVAASERAFRRTVVYPLLRVVFRNPVSDIPIDLDSVKRLLIFRYDRIGDMIITTPILRALKRRNPQLRLGVVASESNAELVQNSPYVDDLYVLESNWFKLLKQVLNIRRHRYDVVLNFVFNRTTSPGILANLIAPKGYKVGQGSDKYAFYFNRLLKLPRFEQHLVETLACYLKDVFGIELKRDELTFEIIVDNTSQRTVDDWLAGHSLHRCSSPKSDALPYMVFNLSAPDKERKVSTDQAAALADHLSRKHKFRTVLLHAPHDQTMRQALEGQREFVGCFVYRPQGARPLAEIASLVDGALFVITPDTSIIHFASAMRTPVLGLYTISQGVQEFLPYRIPYELVVAQSGEPIWSIPHAILTQKADEFIASILRTP